MQKQIATKQVDWLKMRKTKKIVIIGAGNRETSDFILSQISNANYTIAVDAGLDVFYQLKKIPDLIIGDFDSVDKNILRYFRNKTHIQTLPTEKDDSDLEVAIKNALELEPNQIVLIQFLGGRIDHLIINLYQLFHAPGIILLLSPSEKIIALTPRKENKIDEPIGTILSLLPFSQKVINVTTKGLYYPLKNKSIYQNSLTLSNIIADKNPSIYFEEGKLLLYITYKN